MFKSNHLIFSLMDKIIYWTTIWVSHVFVKNRFQISSFLLHFCCWQLLVNYIGHIIDQYIFILVLHFSQHTNFNPYFYDLINFFLPTATLLTNISLTYICRVPKCLVQLWFLWHFFLQVLFSEKQFRSRAALQTW